MKKIIKSVAAAVALLIPINVFGAEMTLKSFDVSGGSIKVTGAVEAEGKQVSMVISNRSQAEGIYQSISGPEGEFAFEIDSEEGWSGSYTATISGEEGETATVDFSGDGSYVSYTEPTEPIPEKGEIAMKGVAYGNRIIVSGCIDNTKVTDSNVILVIYKQTAGNEPTAGDIAYIDQTVADSEGEFSFDFSLLDDARYYKAACFSGGENISEYIDIAKTSSEYIVADVTVEAVSEGGVNMAKMSASLENLGYEASDYMMIITVYDKNGLLIDVMQSDKKTIAVGETAEESLISAEIPEDARTVKAMLWSVGETIIPLDTSATLNIGR